MADFYAVQWIGDGNGLLRLLDQTRLPTEVVYEDYSDVEALHEAIRSLRVRGAPAIGVAAAYGAVLAAQTIDFDDADGFVEAFARQTAFLRTSRPTAVNLFWALNRMDEAALRNAGRSKSSRIDALLAEAHQIFREDVAMCAAIGRHGAALLDSGMGVLTHCNAGALATSAHGTALSVLFAAHDAGKQIHVYVDETRPLLQGSRLTAWELTMRGVPATLICDNMAASLMRGGRIAAAVVGADRIAANGDTANKIGTYSVAISCHYHRIPLFIAAPSSTFDPSIASGAEIPIEVRDPREITHGFGRQTAPDGIEAFNPAFDVTPAELIAGFITEHGVIRPPYDDQLLAIKRR